MNPPSIDWTDQATTVFALLVFGHVLADFLFQTNKMVREKGNSLRVLANHALEVGIVQGIVVLPFFWSIEGLRLVAGIAVVHFAIDWLKGVLDKRYPIAGIWWFLGDQVAHLLVLLLAWRFWPTVAAIEFQTEIGWIAVTLAVIAFNGNGGSAIVGLLLRRLDNPKGQGEGPKGAGRLIGVLERWMILGLVIGGQWGAVGLVLAAKSIARFKRMDEQAFAEYFLVGTLTSVLIAMLSGTLLLLIL